MGDQRRGWALVVRRNDVDLDVEELFVLPEFRRRGCGRKIAKALVGLAAALRAPFASGFHMPTPMRRTEPVVDASLSCSECRWNPPKNGGQASWALFGEADASSPGVPGGLDGLL